MIFFNFYRKRIFKFILSSLSLLFILNIFISFSDYPAQVKKSDNQNIVFIDINSNSNLLINNTKPDKRSSDRISGIKNIINNFDISAGVIFKKYCTSVKSGLTESNPSRAFITALFSTDI